MKPKDLKPQFTFETRRPCLCDGVLYVPHHYNDHALFVCPPLFAGSNPLCVEYCSGNGDWIVAKAQQFPEKNWIAVEKRFDRVRKIWSKVKNCSLNNLLIVCGEAMTFTLHYLKGGCVEEIYINFPDPWPKGKHAKHRLICSSFIEQLSRVLKEGGRVSLATDDLIYLTGSLKLLQDHRAFCPDLDDPHYRLDCPDYGASWFSNLWKEKGRTLYFTTFFKQ